MLLGAVTGDDGGGGKVDLACVGYGESTLVEIRELAAGFLESSAVPM